jgi:hypothetical protein
MKHALVNGQLTPATSDAPAMATCPNCGGHVKLRNRRGTCFWRHVELPRDGCQPPNPESVVTGDDRKRWTRRVGDLLIELHLDAPVGHHLKLRSLSKEKADGSSGLVIGLKEARPLAAVLLDAADEAGRSTQELGGSDNLPL